MCQLSVKASAKIRRRPFAPPAAVAMMMPACDLSIGLEEACGITEDLIAHVMRDGDLQCSFRRRPFCAAASTPDAGSGRYTRVDSARDSPGVQARLPKTRRLETPSSQPGQATSQKH